MTSGKATPVPPKNGYLGLIADYYESQNEDAQAYATRHGNLDDAIRGLLIYLNNADATAAQAGADAETAIQAARKAESDLQSAVQPLAPEMARLNARVTEMNGHFDRLRLAAHEGVAALFKALRELPAGDVPLPGRVDIAKGGLGMMAQVLASELAGAVVKDEDPEAGGCDVSAGMFGPHASDWLRRIAAQLAGATNVHG